MQSTTTRPNRYAGNCGRCRGHVPAGAGILTGRPGAWGVAHTGECPPAAAPAPTAAPARTFLPDVPAGHYAIASGGHNDLAFYRVDRPADGKWAGYTFVKVVIGGRPDSRVPRAQAAGILSRIAAAGIAEAGALYGREIGRCCRCNRHLTDETSRALGIGPECRKAR